ncbi:MAG: sulfoxide reductase heme-binding subunit YedZ, partial [Stutzerimonas stutzeri]
YISTMVVLLGYRLLRPSIMSMKRAKRARPVRP